MREKYQRFQQLPPEKKQEVREQWQKRAKPQGEAAKPDKSGKH